MPHAHTSAQGAESRCVDPYPPLLRGLSKIKVVNKKMFSTQASRNQHIEPHRVLSLGLSRRCSRTGTCALALAIALSRLAKARGIFDRRRLPPASNLRCFFPTPCIFPLGEPALCQIFTASSTKAPPPPISSVTPVKHHLLLFLPLLVVWDEGGGEVGHAISVGCGQS